MPGPAARSPSPGRRAAANMGSAPARLWAHRQATSLPGWDCRAQQRMAAAPVPEDSTVRGQWPAYGGALVRYHPDGRPQVTVHCPWVGPPAFSGSRGRNTVAQARRAKRCRAGPAASRRPPVADGPPASPGRPASSIAGSWRPQTHEPGAWGLLDLGRRRPTISLPHCSWPFRAARERPPFPARRHIHPIRRMLGTSHAADCGGSATHAGGR